MKIEIDLEDVSKWLDTLSTDVDEKYHSELEYCCDALKKLSMYIDYDNGDGECYTIR